VVIDAGPKCIGLDHDQVVLDSHQLETNSSQAELKPRPNSCTRPGALFENELEATAWEEKEREEWRERKSKHDNDNMDTSSFITKLISRL
jgi:hypothetical protein